VCQGPADAPPWGLLVYYFLTLAIRAAAMDRRTFNAALAGAAATSVLGCAAEPRSGAGGGIALYQSVGARLRHFEVDVDGATLTPRAAVELAVERAVRMAASVAAVSLRLHQRQRLGHAAVPGKVHRLCAVRVGANGELQMHGEPQALSTRPIHNSVDATARTCSPLTTTRAASPCTGSTRTAASARR